MGRRNRQKPGKDCGGEGMTTPKRIQRKRTKGWRKPDGAVVVDRTSRFGNPYIVGVHGDAQKCVDLYRSAMGGLIDNTKPPHPPVVGVIKAQDNLRTYGHLLRGKDMVCWCGPDQPCHADVLLEIANSEAK